MLTVLTLKQFWGVHYGKPAVPWVALDANWCNWRWHLRPRRYIIYRQMTSARIQMPTLQPRPI